MNKIYFNGGNIIIFINSKTFFHWIKYISSLQTLTKGDKFDKSLITRTRITTATTTTKSILTPLPQYLLAVKNCFKCIRKYAHISFENRSENNFVLSLCAVKFFYGKYLQKEEKSLLQALKWKPFPWPSWNFLTISTLHSVVYDPISAHFFPCGYNQNLTM